MKTVTEAIKETDFINTFEMAEILEHLPVDNTS